MACSLSLLRVCVLIVLSCQAMLIIIRVGKSKFVTVQIDEDSHERIQTLTKLETKPAVHRFCLKDTNVQGCVLGAQEVSILFHARVL